MNRIFFNVFLLISFCVSCKNDSRTTYTTPTAEEREKSADVYAVDLNGEKLSKWKDPDSLWTLRDKRIEEYRSAYLGKTDDPKAYLRYARAYSEAGRIENAIDLLTKGIEKFPDVADLYTYRGENMLLGRQLSECVDNFWKAGQKLEKSSGSPGLIGMTGDDSIANMSLAYRNYMMMALSFYCNNDLSSADKFFEVCGDFSTNSDLWIRSYYWQYACYSRSGRDADAKNILKNLNENMQILPVSTPYLDAVKYYKGSISESSLVDINALPKTQQEAESWMIKVYAVGVKNLLENKKEKAINAFMKIKEAGYWHNFVSLAAEAELMKIAGQKYQSPEKIELNSKQKRTNPAQ